MSHAGVTDCPGCGQPFVTEVSYSGQSMRITCGHGHKWPVVKVDRRVTGNDRYWLGEQIGR